MDEELKKLMLALTRHADDLQLYANGIAEDALGELTETEDKIFELIGAIFARYKKAGLPLDYATVRYFQDLEERIRDLRAAAFDKWEDDMEDVSREVAEEESKFLSWFYALLIGAEVAAPTTKQLEKIAKYGIFNGNTVRQIFDKLRSGDVQRIFDAITDTLQKGRPMRDALDAVRRELQKSRRFVKSEIETIINGVANDAALAFAAANGTRLVYSAVLDNHVCGECASFNWQIYDYDDPDLPSLPRHVNCRCSLIPVGDGGESVAPATFEDYIKSLSAAEQRKRLGAAKYSAWKNGNYKLKNYETPDPGQKMSMADVRRRRKLLTSAE